MGNEKSPLDKERGVEMEGKGVCFLPMTASGGLQMVKGKPLHEVHFRYRLRELKKAIARALGLSVKTVRKIVKEKPRPYRRAKRGWGILSPYINGTWLETHDCYRCGGYGYERGIWQSHGL